MDREVKVFECICYDENHLMVVTRWWDDDDQDEDAYEWDELSFAIQAHYEAGFWGRIWQGMKYVWNPEDGCFWSSTVLDKENAARLRDALQEYIEGVKPNGKG